MVRRARRATGFLKDFQEFIAKGSVVDLAVGVIIGGAFGKIVTSMVDDIVMPLINPLLAAFGSDYQKWTIGPGIKIGSFLSNIVNFLIIAFVIFLIIKAIAKFQRQEAAAAEEEAAAAPDPNIIAQERLTVAIENLTEKIKST
jgi:large conductance mechanosensitive channel